MDKFLPDGGRRFLWNDLPVPLLSRKFDPNQPRDDYGRWTETGVPRVFNTRDEVVLDDTGWNTNTPIWYWKDKKTGKPAGHLLTGKRLDKTDLPETLYHVTTAADKVKSSGVLLGGREGGGLGGGQAAGVSFTTSEESADIIQRELIRSVRIARGVDGIEAIARYAREDEVQAGLPTGSLDKAVAYAHEGWEGNKFTLERSFVWDKALPEDQRGWVGPALVGEELASKKASLTKDALNAYLQMRDRFAKEHPILKNPILFGDQDKLKHLDEKQVRVLAVPSVNIPDVALITTGSDDFLHEVRAYSDVPVHRTYIFKADKTGRYVTKHVSFAKQGDAQLQLIASLNASRLATWGFAAEAYVRGYTRYKLTSILDGRTSKFCKEIAHGKVFEVEHARKKVNEVLSVQNPNDLKNIQPWPKQTEASLKELRALSAKELTEKGLHIPPYHPRCRTICDVVSNVEVTADTNEKKTSS